MYGNPSGCDASDSALVYAEVLDLVALEQLNQNARVVDVEVAVVVVLVVLAFVLLGSMLGAIDVRVLEPVMAGAVVSIGCLDTVYPFGADVVC